MPEIRIRHNIYGGVWLQIQQKQLITEISWFSRINEIQISENLIGFNELPIRIFSTENIAI